MRIGIIGTGAIGGTIAAKMVDSGHFVKINNASGGEKLASLAKKIGATASTIEDVVKDVDVIIISVAPTVIAGFSKKILNDVSKDVIIVDTANYYPYRDSDIDELKNGMVESKWVSEQLGRNVVKAFNNLLAETLLNGGSEKGKINRIAMAISGDNSSDKEVISILINDAGFDVVDAGNLSESWRHQPGTPGYCTELNAVQLQEALKNAVEEDAATLRDLAISELGSRKNFPSHEEIVSFNRSMFSTKF